jgi:hypothetical protein
MENINLPPPKRRAPSGHFSPPTDQRFGLVLEQVKVEVRKAEPLTGPNVYVKFRGVFTRPLEHFVVYDEIPVSLIFN